MPARQSKQTYIDLTNGPKKIPLVSNLIVKLATTFCFFWQGWFDTSYLGTTDYNLLG